VAVHNESPEAIHLVTLQMRIPSGACLPGGKNDWEEKVSALPPGETLQLEATFSIPWRDKTLMDMPEVTPNALVSFTDAADQEWSRSTRDFRLRRIERKERRRYGLFGPRKSVLLVSRER
jgi:hypothetical protein